MALRGNMVGHWWNIVLRVVCGPQGNMGVATLIFIQWVFPMVLKVSKKSRGSPALVIHSYLKLTEDPLLLLETFPKKSSRLLQGLRGVPKVDSTST